MEAEQRKLAQQRADQALNLVNKTRSGSGSRLEVNDDAMNTTQGKFKVDRIETD